MIADVPCRGVEVRKDECDSITGGSAIDGVIAAVADVHRHAHPIVEHHK